MFTAGGAALRAARSGWGAEGTLGSIAFIQRDGLWTRSLPGGRFERLAGAAGLDSPRFSPTGRWIACFQGDLAYAIPRGGGERTAIGRVNRGGASPGAQWLPDGDELLVDGPAGLEVFTAEDGWRKATRRIAGAGLPAVFSPHGEEMVYGDTVNGGGGLEGQPVRTGRLCRVALRRPDSQPRVLLSKRFSGLVPCAWSGDGRQIAFWEDADFSASAMADGLELFSIPADGGSARALGVSTLVHGDVLSLSPDGTCLAASAGGGRYQWQDKRIAVIDLNTAAITHLTDNRTAAVCPSWRPRGDRIAFAAAPGPGAGAGVGGGAPARRLLENRRIWMTAASGTSLPRQLTSDGAYRDEEPMWSADGSHILFGRMDRAGNRTLWLMDAESPRPAQVAGPLDASPEQPGPDDAWFGYYGYLGWRRVVDWSGGAA